MDQADSPGNDQSETKNTEVAVRNTGLRHIVSEPCGPAVRFAAAGGTGWDDSFFESPCPSPWQDIGEAQNQIVASQPSASDMNDQKKGRRRRKAAKPPTGHQASSAPASRPEGFEEPPFEGAGPDQATGFDGADPTGAHMAGGEDVADRPWRRNLRRRAPSTPENSWLATQPEFQKFWGHPAEPEPEPHPYDPAQQGGEQGGTPWQDHSTAPQNPVAAPIAPRPRPHRKPADISTLMARYTARAEEREKLAPPPPRYRSPPQEPAIQNPQPGAEPDGTKAPPRPAPAQVKNTDPRFVASPLPAEPPEAEPGRPAQRGSSGPAPVHQPAPRPGSIIVADGQVKVVEADAADVGDLSEDTSNEGQTNPPPQTQPQREDVLQPATKPGHIPPPGAPHIEVIPPVTTQGQIADPDALEPATQTPPQAEVNPEEFGPAPDAGADGNGIEAQGIEPPTEPQRQEDWWPPEPSIAPELVRFDGPLPYQQQTRDPASGSLSDWNIADEQVDFEPAWHARQGGMGRGRRMLLILAVLAVAGVGGYGVWSSEAKRWVDLAFSPAPQSRPQLQLPEEPVTRAAPEVATRSSETGPATLALPQAPAPLGPDPVPGTTPLAGVAEGSRLAPDPAMKTRQTDDPGTGTSTLWWKPKSVTQFPALTPAELAGQPEPPAARGEAVMAPTGPLDEPSPQSQAAIEVPTTAQAPRQVNQETISRIDELLRSYAIKDADAAIEPLIATAPNDAAALLLRGRSALAKFANFEAMAIFDRALAAEPANADAAAGRGRALVNLGRATEAGQIAESLLAVQPNHLGGMWLGATALATTGKLDAALEICGRMEAAGAEAGSGEWCRGVANKRARKPLEAETIFTDALQSGGRDFVALRQLYFRFKGYYSGAIDGFSNDDLIQAATRCAATRDCDTAGL